VKPLPMSSFDRFQADHVRPKDGRTLIVGSHVYPGRVDRRPLFKSVLGVDMVEGEGVDVVCDLEEPNDLGTFSHIECLSVLEHSRRPWLLAANLEQMLEPSGTLFVAVPFAWRIHAYPDDYWRMTPAGVRSLFPDIAWQAMAICADDLYEGPKIPIVKKDGFPYIIRSEVVGFGRK
jgi:hypothetical protein